MALVQIPRLAAAVLAALLVAPAARADSFRCDGGIVATGDSKLDLLGKCGPPTLAEGSPAQRSTLEVEAGAARRVVDPVELWTYDLGRNRFVQLVRLVRGRIASIERGSYGYAEAQGAPVLSRRATCDSGALAEGALELDVLARCGDPAVVDAWQEELAAVHPAGDDGVAAAGVARTIRVLTYDFGPSQLVRYVRVEDGKVTRVETGSYGYAR